jgi:hypothetical protein
MRSLLYLGYDDVIFWYQSWWRLVLRWGDCDIPQQKRASRVRALLVVLAANMLYAFENHAGQQPWDGRDPKWTVYDKCGSLRYSTVCFLGHQAQKWACVTKNKTVRKVRPKTENIQHVGPDCYNFKLNFLVDLAA